MKEKDKEKEKDEMPNLKKEFTVGMSAMIVNSILLFAGVYVFSLLYKLGAQGAQDGAQYFSDVIISQVHYVHPFAGLAGILALFLFKNWYDFRFYKIQIQARNDRARVRRVLEWILYVLVTLLLIVWIFLRFSCGKSFFDDYTFESAPLGNFAYSLLYVVTPLLYIIHAIVRAVLKKAGVQLGDERPMTRAERRREARVQQKRK